MNITNLLINKTQIPVQEQIESTVASGGQYYNKDSKRVPERFLNTALGIQLTLFEMCVRDRMNGLTENYDYWPGVDEAFVAGIIYNIDEGRRSLDSIKNATEFEEAFKNPRGIDKSEPVYITFLPASVGAGKSRYKLDII